MSVFWGSARFWGVAVNMSTFLGLTLYKPIGPIFLIFFENSHLEMDDGMGVPPFQETSTWLSRNISHVLLVHMRCNVTIDRVVRKNHYPRLADIWDWSVPSKNARKVFMHANRGGFRACTTIPPQDPGGLRRSLRTSRQTNTPYCTTVGLRSKCEHMCFWLLYIMLHPIFSSVWYNPVSRCF